MSILLLMVSVTKDLERIEAEYTRIKNSTEPGSQELAHFLGGRCYQLRSILDQLKEQSRMGVSS